MLEDLLREKQQLLKKKEAALRTCDMPKVRHYTAMLEQLEQTIQAITKKPKQ